MYKYLILFIQTLNIAVFCLPVWTVNASDSCLTNLAAIPSREYQTNVILGELARLRLSVESGGLPKTKSLTSSLAKAYKEKLEQTRGLGISLLELPRYVEEERTLQSMTDSEQRAAEKKQSDLEKNFSPWVLQDEIAEPRAVATYALSRTGAQMARALSGKPGLIIRDLRSAKDILTIEVPPYPITSVRFSPDGSRVLVVTNQKFAILYDAVSGKELKQFIGHTETIVDAVFSPDGTMIGTASADGTAGIWDISSGKPLHFLRVHPDIASSIQFNYNSSKVITACFNDDHAAIWNVKTGALLSKVEDVNQLMSLAVFSAFGDLVLSRTGLARLAVTDLNSGKRMEIDGSAGPALVRHSAPFLATAYFHPSEPIVATAYKDRLSMWDLKDNHSIELFRNENGAHIDEIAFNGSGSELAVASYSMVSNTTSIVIIDNITSISKQHLSIPERSVQLEFTSDQSTLVARSKAGRLFVWKRKTSAVTPP